MTFDPNVIIGKRLRQRRRLLGLTQAQAAKLARLCVVLQTTPAAILDGRHPRRHRAASRGRGLGGGPDMLWYLLLIPPVYLAAVIIWSLRDRKPRTSYETRQQWLDRQW